MRAQTRTSLPTSGRLRRRARQHGVSHRVTHPLRCGDVRALVTGGRGFVGTWLVEHLRAEGDDVVSIDHEVEITDAVAVRDAVVGAMPDAIYHLAALTHVGRSWTDPGQV